MALASAIRYAKGTCEVSTLSWNLAAINNNPFEYFLTHPDPEYAKLMADVEGFIESPGDKDAVVGSVFTQEMYGSLTASMKQCGWDCSSVEAVWSEDLAKRTIVGGFLKDKGLGAKRLMSMPDRFTNTIDLADGTIANRPTIISNYDGDMSTMAKWWDAWKSFMFENTLSVAKKGGSDSKKPYELLSPIQRAKYPALSEAEEAMCALPSAELLATCCAPTCPRPRLMARAPRVLARVACGATTSQHTNSCAPPPPRRAQVTAPADPLLGHLRCDPAAHGEPAPIRAACGSVTVPPPWSLCYPHGRPAAEHALVPPPTSHVWRGARPLDR